MKVTVVSFLITPCSKDIPLIEASSVPLLPAKKVTVNNCINETFTFTFSVIFIFVIKVPSLPPSISSPPCISQRSTV